MEPVSTNLRLLRLLFNYSQGGVARGSGIKQQTISLIEKGRYQPNFIQIKKLAQCFGVNAECLYKRNLQQEIMKLVRQEFQS